jgi:hypothetical protein
MVLVNKVFWGVGETNRCQARPAAMQRDKLKVTCPYHGLQVWASGLLR